MRLTRRTAVTAGLAGTVSALLPYRDASAQAPSKGGTLNVHYSFEQRVLNPAIRAGVGVNMVASKMIEPLVDLGTDGQIVGVLATSWSASEDGRSIAFRLRDGVAWHDGRPFTAADVQYNAMELWRKHQNYGTQLHRDLEAVDTPDARTAVFRYARPMPLDLMLRALCDLGYVVPRHLYEGSNPLENPANTAPVGTGPFRFTRYERGQYVSVERNPSYWRQDAPHLDRIFWHIIPDKAAAAAALETGRLHLSTYSTLALSDLDRLAKDSRFEVSGRGLDGNSINNTVGFNLRRKELSDVRVRRAIAHAIDVPFFIENFLYGFGRPATGPIPSVAKAFYPGGEPPYPFDRARAERLLDEAGYRKDSRGQRFRLKIVPIQNGEDVPLFATFVQQSLRPIGIEAEIVNYDYAGAINAVNRDWDFDLALDWHRFRGDPAISTTVWYTSGSPKGAPWTNQFGWVNEQADELAAQAASALDPARRKALYAEWVALVNAELPVWMATERQEVAATDKRVRNHHNTPRWDSSDYHDTWLAG
ncbi:ABC transporter substrate-binding protein [Roseomonas sp. OT10]|uniref:ABC transporter substrate-binding protein n=1 Tax=Roseomonas cutis TaxID=2897332 RepID=UPI001E4D4017|nr:ABC transporter substrate-binding protein [Roseomonas sp. OT10]UFN50637.1 ABC transporter substrate-binding protein [Roseomonas sp. OT10]